MSSSAPFVGAVVRVMQTPAAIDRIQDLHVDALGVSGGDAGAAKGAYADLSGAICAALGQLAATDANAGGAVLRSSLAAANRRGVDGIESILLSAFLSAVRGGFSPPVGDAAAVWLELPFPNRLAGGAYRVPLLDPETLSIGSVSASELVLAVNNSAGSADELAERLQRLVDPSGGEVDAAEADDGTLEPVARACAEAFAATTTAGHVLEAFTPDSALAAAVNRVLDMTTDAWRGPSSQLQSGKVLALAIGASGTGALIEDSDPEPLPAGLRPRPRAGLETIVLSGPAGARSRLVPAQVTKEPPSWYAIAGHTAELRPPLELRPTPMTSRQTGTAPAGALRRTPPRGRAGGRGRGHVPSPYPGVTKGTPVVPIDPLTGAPVDATGQPIGPSPGELSRGELAEACIVEATRLGIDVRTVMVADAVDLFVAAEAEPGEADGLTT